MVILKFLSIFKAFLQNHPVIVVLVGGCLAHDEESVFFEGFVHVFEGFDHWTPVGHSSGLFVSDREVVEDLVVEADVEFFGVKTGSKSR